jgi:hypothetical protein
MFKFCTSGQESVRAPTLIRVIRMLGALCRGSCTYVLCIARYRRMCSNVRMICTVFVCARGKWPYVPMYVCTDPPPDVYVIYVLGMNILYLT